MKGNTSMASKTLLTKKDEDLLKEAGKELGLTEVTHGIEFYDRLKNDTLTPEWISNNALWLQFEDESDEEYEQFRFFVAQAIDDWLITDTGLAERNLWRERRMMYLKYKEWLERRKAELEQLDDINEFQQNEAAILSHTSSSLLTLLDKLEQRINDIEPEDINVRDIPTFINAVSKFSELTADARARALAVDKLLKLHEEEMEAALLRQTIEQIGEANI